MKRVFCAVPALVFFGFLTLQVQGIPNSFGGTSFINPAGMRLEDFAAQEGIWERNAELKGTWEMWRDESVTDSTVELLHLNMPAIVFGVAASEVTVQRKDDIILQFQVVFEPGEQIKDFKKLNHMIRTNAAVWSGGDASSDSMKEGAASYTFKSDPDNEKLVLVIKAAR